MNSPVYYGIYLSNYPSLLLIFYFILDEFCSLREFQRRESLLEMNIRFTAGCNHESLGIPT